MTRCRPRGRSAMRTAAVALLGSLAMLPAASAAQTPAARDTAAKDPMQEGLPLRPDRTLEFTTNVGTWLSLDVSPDGRTIVFDLLGDLYTMPITGGTATPLTQGMAMDAQPRFSPDGQSVVFTSDRDGGQNVWIIRVDRSDTTQVTKGKAFTYDSPEWAPDGNYVFASRGLQLWMYHVKGGSGVQVINQPNVPGQQPNRYVGAAFGSDPRYIWLGQREGMWNYNTKFPEYQIAVYDRESGETSVRTFRQGSALRPTLSPDGKWLVYATRHGADTGLILRDLESGSEQWLAYPVQRDDQESFASRDTYPGMSFTPDSRSLIVSYGGRIWNVPVDGSAQREIPFEANVRLAMAPRVQFDFEVEDEPTFTVQQIRDAVPSPDGRRLAFTALDRLWVMDFPSGTPRRVTNARSGEFHPAWSPDGQSLAYTTWTDTEGGHIYRVSARGGEPQRLTQAIALYQQPVWSPDGTRIVAIRGPARALQQGIGPGAPGGAADFIWVPASGGESNFIAPTSGRTRPHFTEDGDRIYAYGGGQLVSFRWDGTDVRSIVRVTGQMPPNAPPGATAPNAGLVIMAPRGDQALAQVNNDLYVVTVPRVGATAPTISVANPENAAFPARKLTEIGGQFPTWGSNGRVAHWSIGNAHVVYDLDAARTFDDSVSAANRTPAARPDSAAGDSAASAPRPARNNTPKFQPLEVRVTLNAERDIPRGVAVLRGARIVTMRGTEVIENGDVVVRDNRIVAVGPRGQVDVPADARVIDVSGKTIVPGFVDTHAHLGIPFGIHKGQIWSYAANLAYGVTTVRDPQTGSTDVLSYADQVDTGALLGPRIYSTGPGVFGGENFRDLDHARNVLRRYSDYYDTKTIKQYVAGNREQRQWVIQAARELRLMPTTEGALDLEMNVTEAFDGYSGHEHNWPSFPFQSDLIRVFAESNIAYTPTILVAYGGPWAENYWFETEDLVNDAKFRYFTPYDEFANKALRRGNSPGTNSAGWFHESEHVFPLIAQHANELLQAGGRVGVGSHGQLQGLGYHWELWSVASGGMSNHDALRVATLMGADIIGFDNDLGSIEAGKLADLVVLDRNPLENIRNSNSVNMVMKNGRLYNASTLAEIFPQEAPAPVFHWVTEGPRAAAGLR